MPLDISGALLEGVRISSGNNPFTFPPRNGVLPADAAAFNAISARAEYVLIAASLDPAKKALEIADPDLRFAWTKNESSVVRFFYDSFSQRWLPSPGSSPDVLGPLSNDPRLTFPVPDPAVTDAPFAVYVGSPARSVTFAVQIVGTEGDFSPPGSVPAGTVQLSKADGKLNFGQADLDGRGGETVYGLRQSFFDRSRSTGSFGILPDSSLVEYFLFLNPKPATGQVPRVRIGYGSHLTSVQVANEAALGTPAAGTFRWSLDTGRIRFSPSDVSASAAEKVYYDGVTLGLLQVPRRSVGHPPGWPATGFDIPEAVDWEDPLSFIVYAELSGQPRRYWRTSLLEGVPGSAPPSGTVIIDIDSGDVYLNPGDAVTFSSWIFSYLFTFAQVEDGVSVQFFRSGANGTGEASVPDFTIAYEIEDQVIVDGVSPSPFAMLPTTPVTNAGLSYSVAQGQGSSGTFTGPLVDGTDPSEPGLGYLLDLDSHQISFSNRKSASFVLQRPVPAVKLEDAAISRRGFVAEVGGSPAVPGVDFVFDADSGIISFTSPVGQNDPADRDLSGTAVLPVQLTAGFGAFSSADEGRFLFVPSGANAGVYLIAAVPQSDFLLVSPQFKAAGAVDGSIRTSADVVADRFWTLLDPPLKKFSLARAPSPGGPFTAMSTDDFGVFANSGQVNLTDPAQPGEAFRATYVALVTTDDGATYVPVNRVEMALFKVRQEAASTVPGSNVATFNADGHTVSLGRPMTVYLDGVTLGDAFFEFVAPGTLKLVNPVLAGQAVVLDYWVEDAPGGNTNFNLLATTVDLDSPKIVAGSPTATFNGDQAGILSAGSALFVGRSEVLIAQDVDYDPSQDVTIVTLDVPASADSAGAEILVCGPVGTSDYMVPEGSGVSTMPRGSNAFFVGGDASARYRSGTVVRLDLDPYSVLNSEYDAVKSRTKVTLASAARRNYVLPSLSRSIRPVFFAGKSFQTASPPNLSFPFTLALMGEDNKILSRDVDYSVTDGGTIELEEPAGFGDSLVALYVAQSVKPAGTLVSLNYAYAIAPGPGNGLQGQRLMSSYDLYAPDTFFYRVETVTSFIPEVQDALRQSAQSGGVSGPNTRDAVGQGNKDFGVPGPYFDEQHEHNVDVVTCRLLKLYNDLINFYEDFLSDVDGRVVGGRSGKFRFDGNFSNPPRQSYSEITNDIDDRIKLYDRIKLVGFFSFQTVPVYGTMATPNSLSRIFPTLVPRRAALNDKTGTSDFGQPMGSLDLDGIRSVGTLRSARAGQLFESEFANVYSIPQNGQPDVLVPPFASGQDVIVSSDDGVLAVSTTVVSATATTVTLGAGTSLRRGSILQDVSDFSNPVNHFYAPGRDLEVDPENGQIVNATVDPGGIQVPVAGNEVVEGQVSYNNSSTSPARPPVLDGLGLDDSGYPPSPRLRRRNEYLLLDDEIEAMSRLGTARVDVTLSVVYDATVPVSPGDLVLFVSGPSSGLPRFVNTILTPSSFTVTFPFNVQDAAGSSYVLSNVPPTVQDVLDEEILVIDTGTSAAPVPPALIGPVDSELKSLVSAILDFGPVIGTGNATAAPASLTDPGGNFTVLGVDSGTLVFVPTGSNAGLYSVSSATATVLTLDTASPFAPLPSGGPTPYQLVQPEAFFDPGQYGLVSRALRETLAFLASTLAWQASPTVAGKVARIAAIAVRQSQLASYGADFPSALRDGGLYDTRYLWIQQRTDRKDGNLTREKQAALRRVESLAKLVADQKKLLVIEDL